MYILSSSKQLLAVRPGLWVRVRSSHHLNGHVRASKSGNNVKEQANFELLTMYTYMYQLHYCDIIYVLVILLCFLRYMYLHVHTECKTGCVGVPDSENQEL